MERYLRLLWFYVKDVDLPMRAASASYYSMLASIPLIAIIITISAHLVPTTQNSQVPQVEEATLHKFYTYMGMVMPPEADEAITHEIARVQQQTPVGLLSLGLLFSAWTASNAFVAIISAMNHIYGVRETRSLVDVRLRAMIIPLVLSLIFVAALLSIVALPYVINFLDLDVFAGSLVRTGQWVALFIVLTLNFSLSYRYGPNKFPRERWLNAGAITGAVIFLLAGFALQLYAANFKSYEKVYGSLGGAIALLVWIYVTNSCLLFGCAINKTMQDAARERKAFDRMDKTTVKQL